MNIKSWNIISNNPGGLKVSAYKAKTLEKARDRKLIYNRVVHIIQRAKDRKVLDIGVVEHFSESASLSNWLHHHLAKAASSYLGIDILDTKVGQLRERGFNVQRHDITESPLDQKFELIIVGDVVEHLSNPSALFNNTAAMLEKNGRLLILTPNPWFINAILKNVFEGMPFTDSADHVAWCDTGTLCELASRNGLALKHYYGVRADKSGSLKSALFFKMASLFIMLRMRPEIFAKTMIYEFTLSAGHVD